MSESTATTSSTQTLLRIASVSYLNAKPLLWGIDSFDDLQLQLDVPAKLLDQMKNRAADVALLPVIDYQRLDDLLVVPAGGIGCDGHTLTVRIFSKTPIHAIQSLACDVDSHTSVALARIILAEQFGITPAFRALTDKTPPDEPRLLIGDKVVCDEPQGFPHQLDLGFAWKELTGLPFVFAVWMARRGVDLRDLPERLSQARVEGLRHVDELVEKFAVPRGWPATIARQYMTSYLKYEIGERQLRAISLFHELAHKHQIVPFPRLLEVQSG